MSASPPGRKPWERENGRGTLDETRLHEFVGKNASTMICVPTSLDQEVGAALGAQAGEAKLSEVISSGGFSEVRLAEGPVNMVLEAR